MTVIAAWIDGYSNAGYKIKTESIKNELASLQKRYPEKNYELLRRGGKWFIVEGEK
jgi:hypothetical protein